MAIVADSFITFPKFPVILNFPLPLLKELSINKMSPPTEVHAKPVTTPAISLFKYLSLSNITVDLTKINIKTLATQVGVLSEDVKLFMKLVTSNRYYALNDRTIALLMKGDIDMSVMVVEIEEYSPSDKEITKILETETEV